MAIQQSEWCTSPGMGSPGASTPRDGGRQQEMGIAGNFCPNLKKGAGSSWQDAGRSPYLKEQLLAVPTSACCLIRAQGCVRSATQVGKWRNREGLGPTLYHPEVQRQSSSALPSS